MHNKPLGWIDSGGSARIAPRVVLGVMLLWTAAARPADAQQRREAAGRRAPVSEGEREARRLLQRGTELMELGERLRAIRMIESVIEQYPRSRAALEAHLTLGRHYVDQRDELKAIRHLSELRALAPETGDQPLTGADRDLFLESLYLTGVAHFQTRQYEHVFPVLRRITTRYPNTVWANQAYFYIGLSHFAQRNWGRAIESLSLVGTFVDPDSPAVQYVEADRRLYVKIEDADLPILVDLGHTAAVEFETDHGDRERIELASLGAQSALYIGSIPTAVGLPVDGDGILQLVGGGTVTVRYLDANTESGEADVIRETILRVVSTASLDFVLGDLETRATLAYMDQPLHLLLFDADLDVSDAADTAQVTLVSRYRDYADEPEEETLTASAVDLNAIDESPEQDRMVERDRITVTLRELGDTPPIRSGRFAGTVFVRGQMSAEREAPGDAPVLDSAPGDEIVVVYEDALHIGGESPRVVEVRIPAGSALDSRPQAIQDVVADAIVRAEKDLVEATAYLELARIFRDMGLTDGGAERALEGLARVDAIIRDPAAIPVSLRQQAFLRKWELHLAAGDTAGALAASTLFSRMFPTSPLVGEALMGMGRVHLEETDYPKAIAAFQRVLSLPRSEFKGEAMFRIAEATETMGLDERAASGGRGGRGGSARITQAIEYYRQSYQRFPDHPFAANAINKVVDHLIEARNFVEARNLLVQVFEDYPDAAFLDSMLLKWVLVAFRSGNLLEAQEKCRQLLLSYPDSRHAAQAQQILPRIEERLGAGH